MSSEGRLLSTEFRATSMTTDCNGVVRWANACLSNLTGCASDEIVGQNAEMLESENTTHPMHDILQHVVASGEAWRGESVGKRKNGELYDIEQTVSVRPTHLFTRRHW